MFKTIMNWLVKPYPFPNTLKSKFLISFGFGSFVFLFLLLFKPFNFDDLKNKEFYFAVIYGLITFSVLFINLFLLPIIFKKVFNLDNWTIYKMLLFVLNLLFFISVFNTLFSNQSHTYFKKIDHLFLFFIVNTFLVGVFPLLIYMYFSERIINKKHSIIAKNISETQNKNPKTTIKEKIDFVIFGDNKNEKLDLSLDDLLYISYEKNYASIFYLQNEKIKETLLRTSLNKIEQQLKAYPFVVRCHKSYIINTNKVEEIKGNARSYLLKIQNLEVLIPVSRSFPKELLFTLVKS